MLVTFITTVKALLRDRSILMWAVAFPLVLSTLFFAMFSNLDEAYKLKPIDVVVVDDANFRAQAAAPFKAMIAQLSAAGVHGGGAGDSGGTAEDGTVDGVAGGTAEDEAVGGGGAGGSTEDGAVGSGGAGDDSSALLAPRYVGSEAEALAALEQGDFAGYLMLDDDLMPVYHADSRKPDSAGTPVQAILVSIANSYAHNVALMEDVLAENPDLKDDPVFLERLAGIGAGGGRDGALSDAALPGGTRGSDGDGGFGDAALPGGTGGSDGDGSGSDSISSSNFTRHVQAADNTPSDSIRYYYVVLAFSVFMMSCFALIAVGWVQANSSALGARRSLGGQSKLRTLVPTLAAAWLLSFACCLLGFLYQRLVFGIDFGGKEALVLLTLAVGALAVCFFGAFIGALPISEAVKSGIVSVSSCFLSLFGGMFGRASQQIGDYVARELPVLSAMNPVRQLTDAFLSLYYYDGYERLTECLGNLLAFGAVLFVAAVLMMRRQRHASL